LQKISRNAGRHKMGLSRRGFLAGLSGVPFLAACDGGPRRPKPLRPIAFRCYPISSFRPGSEDTRFGALTFLSGLEIESDDPEFGGLSALRVMLGGTSFHAISDQGNWLRGDIIRDGDTLVAIGNAEIGPVLAEDGAPLASRWEHDTESLAYDGITAFVASEVENRIYRFAIGADGLVARAEPLNVPTEIGVLDSYYGLESLSIMPIMSRWPGALIALAEDDPYGKGRIPGWVIPETGAALRFSILKKEGFRLTDCAFLPGGDLLVLERKQTVWEPVQCRLRRIALLEIGEGAELEGTIVFAADAAAQIDNMEGLSIHRDVTGATILTMVSDNNTSVLQRSLILQWKWNGSDA
jgi:hypothetical protein